MSSPRPTVVVTGLGATTPLGGDVTSTWEGVLAGRTGARTLTEDWVAEHELPVLDHTDPRYAEYIPGGAPSTPANPSNTPAPEDEEEGGHH